MVDKASSKSGMKDDDPVQWLRLGLRLCVYVQAPLEFLPKVRYLACLTYCRTRRDGFVVL